MQVQALLIIYLRIFWREMSGEQSLPERPISSFHSPNGGKFPPPLGIIHR